MVVQLEIETVSDNHKSCYTDPEMEVERAPLQDYYPLSRALYALTRCCVYKLGVHFLGVFIIRALLFGGSIQSRPPEFRRLPSRGG